MTGVTGVTDLVRVTGDNTEILRSVAEDVFDGQLSPELVDGLVASDSRLIIVAVVDGMVVGQAQGAVQSHLDGRPQLYIDNLGVAAQAQRRGVARALLGEMARWGAEQGCRQAWIVTEPDHAANALYLSIGAFSCSVTMYTVPTPLDSKSRTTSTHS